MLGKIKAGKGACSLCHELYTGGTNKTGNETSLRVIWTPIDQRQEASLSPMWTARDKRRGGLYIASERHRGESSGNS